MAFTTPNVAGGTVTLRHGDKFTVDGEELVITGLGAYGKGLRTRRPPPGAVSTAMVPFSQLNPSTLQPEYGASVTVRAQFKADTEERNQLMTVKDGPDQPATYKIAYLQEANTAAAWPLIRVVLQDKAHGLMFAGLYTVRLIPPPVVTVAGDPELSIPPTTTPAAAVSLTVRKVDLREQWLPDGNGKRKVGDALIVVSREGLSLDSLLADGAFIEVGAVGVNSGTARQYQVTGPDGITPLATFDWCIYLKRVGS
jgi:hypothetical protein